MNLWTDRRQALVVDDDPAIRRLCKPALDLHGIDTVEAADCESGFRIYADSKADFALVLLDIVLPGGGGVALANRILALDTSANIIFMTGYGAHSTIPVELKSTCEFLDKPFRLDQLSAAIVKVLARDRASSTA